MIKVILQRNSVINNMIFKWYWFSIGVLLLKLCSCYFLKLMILVIFLLSFCDERGWINISKGWHVLWENKIKLYSNSYTKFAVFLLDALTGASAVEIHTCYWMVDFPNTMNFIWNSSKLNLKRKTILYDHNNDNFNTIVWSSCFLNK